MANQPNILFLMTDQMQGRTVEPDHPCRTPNFDRLAERGVRFTRAYTPNAVCSPARASLMTGLLPHTHGVLEVTHCVDDDQCVLRTEHPHWAQRLEEEGYRNGYFGKWHVERSNNLSAFGWQTDFGSQSDGFRAYRSTVQKAAGKERLSFSRKNNLPAGYNKTTLYGATNRPPEARGMGVTTDLALQFIEEAVEGSDPWCCFASVTEPHDPFIAGEEAFALYDVDSLELPPNVHDDMSDRPGVYRKAARAWADMTDREKKEAAACYYASITEIDAQFGRLLNAVEEAGQLQNTIVVLTSDHGELLGAHGLYCKNFTGFEEVYHIPLIVSGPGVQEGSVSSARVGLHDLAPTLLELADAEPIGAPDSRSFASALLDPEGASANFTQGFAEYHGGRYRVTQRVVWDGSWKLVWNGFDFDELYDLETDPYEMRNRIDDPSCRERVESLMRQAWRVVRDTKDGALFNSHYPILRLAPVGPNILDD